MRVEGGPLGRLSASTRALEATDAVRHPCDPTTSLANDITLFASLELSKSKWVVTIISPGSETRSSPSMWSRVETVPEIRRELDRIAVVAMQLGAVERARDALIRTDAGGRN
jgi:hypothetical protein